MLHKNNKNYTTTKCLNQFVLSNVITHYEMYIKTAVFLLFYN